MLRIMYVDRDFIMLRFCIVIFFCNFCFLSLVKSQSLTECLEVASKFRNTCPSLINASSNIRDMPGQLVTCMDVGQCQDKDTSLQCIWTRQLCVTCRQVGNEVKIRIQTNAMPDHCYYSPMVPPVPKYIDYEVAFDKDINGRRFAPESNSELDQIVCNKTMVSDEQVPAEYNFIRTEYNLINTWPPAPKLSLDKIVGVAINGVPFITALDDNNEDTWSASAREKVKQPIDTCLGHTTADGMYSYPLIPVCIHDVREIALQSDILHPMSRQFLCNWKVEGHDGCRNISTYMLREYVSSEFRSEYKENVLYNSHGKNRRRLSLEESPFEGPPKFQVRAYIGGDTSSYTISGASGNPTLTLLRSKTYIFDIATNGHPFMIQYADGTAYTDGMNFERSSWGDSGYAGMDRGTITFTIPENAPNTLYYRCTRHSIVMEGELRIVVASTAGNTGAILPVGCDGIFGSGLKYDQCGRCGGTNTDKDACGVCFGDNATCTGCDGIVNSGKKLDLCGVCDGSNECVNHLQDASNKVQTDSASVVVHAQSTAANTTENTVKKIFQRKGQHILGVAKDGHAIFGPYYSDGSEATSGVDICNGANLDTDGDKVTDTYGYFVRRSFPYVLSCYGPGNYPTAAKPSCTASPPSSYLPWLNYTYPGIAPPPFDNGEFQPRHKPNAVKIDVTSVSDSSLGNKLSRCNDLEKHSDVQSGFALVGTQLHAFVKRITVVFPTPFLTAPTISRVKLGLNLGKSTMIDLQNGYLLSVVSTDENKFIFDVTEKNGKPWQDILFVDWEAVSPRRLDCTMRSSIVEMEHIDSNAQYVIATMKVNHTTLNFPLIIPGSSTITLNGPSERVIVSPGSAWSDGMGTMIEVSNTKETPCTMNNFVFEKTTRGCILVNNGGTLILTNSIIQDNDGLSKGAGMTVLTNAMVTMTNVIFRQNHVKTSFLEGVAGGAALFIYPKAIVSLSGGLVEYNTAVNSRGDTHGGAILNHGSLSIDTTLIQHNQAISGLYNRHGETGHAIPSRPDASRKTSETDTTGHVGYGHGGAIYHDGEKFIGEDLTIFNNSASQSGGAAFYTRAMTLKRCTVQNNTAKMGPAFRSPAYTENPHLENCNVFWNSCSIERSSGQALTESYYPGQESVPLEGAYGFVHHVGLPPQKISYYDNL